MLKIIKPEEYLTTQWSGGTTTQFYIYPENSTYTSRNFDLRISSAVINQSPSNFTSLKGFSRVLISLNHEISISHEGQNPVILKPLQIYTFSGDSETQSKGLATDFNIIYSSKVKVETTVIMEQVSELILRPGTNEIYFVYLIDGNLMNNKFKAGYLLYTNEALGLLINAENKLIIVKAKFA